VEGDRIVAADLRHPLEEISHSKEAIVHQSANSPVVSDVSGHRRLLQDFIRAIEINGSPRCNGHEARRSVELVQAIYESSLTDGPVRLHPQKII